MLKEFLKPDWKKILIFAIIFGIIGFIIWPLCLDLPTDTRTLTGFPFTFFILESNGGVVLDDYDVHIPPEFYIQFFALDIILDYLLSCLIIFVYNKYIGKKKVKR